MLTVRDVFIDFGIMSLVMVLAHLVRYKIRVFQAIYLPSSVLAGLICLICGNQLLNIMPFSHGEHGYNLATYPTFLVVMLFTTLFLGKRHKTHTMSQMLEHAGDTFFYNLASLLGQYGIALLFGLLCLDFIFSSLPHGFAIFLPAGFIGGYGTAAAIGEVLERYGWEGAKSIGYASATVGMLSAVFGGMVIVNIATRRGWTRFVESVQKMPKSMRTGFVSEEEGESIGRETVHSIALDSLTWHFALVIAISMLAISFTNFISTIDSFPLELPAFCIALLIGGIAQKLFDFAGLGEYIDRQMIHRIGSFVTDFLVAFGIAAITLKVVLQYAGPLVVLFIFGFAFTILFGWFVGQKICRTFWFERSMAMYGWSVGSVATSVLLLRVIDPKMRSQILEDFGLAYILISFFEISVIAFLPTLIGNGVVWIPTLILCAGFIACIILSRYLVGWFRFAPDEIRPGELELINSSDED